MIANIRLIARGSGADARATIATFQVFHSIYMTSHRPFTWRISLDRWRRRARSRCGGILGAGKKMGGVLGGVVCMHEKGGWICASGDAGNDLAC